MTKWKVLNTEEIFKSGLFRLRMDKCKLPDGRIMPRYFTFEFPDWVQAVAVTKSGELVMLTQYRHSAENEFIEIPGGSTDPNTTEDPLEAAKRELLEETGYTSSKWQCVGVHYPNPALQTNRIHTYLALDCEKTAEPSLDPYEDLEVMLMSAKDVYEKAHKGEVTHSLILASLFLAQPYLMIE